MNVPDPTRLFADGMLAGHAMGLEIARREIRKAIGPSLWRMRMWHVTLHRAGMCDLCDGITAIDRATRAPRKARAK